MDSFINYSIISASFILILILAIMGVLIYRANSTGPYPPVISNCPDYWSYDPTDTDPAKTSSGTCYNTMKLGTCTTTEKQDFSTWGMCKKQTWARNCNITWDGISNAKSLCTS